MKGPNQIATRGSFGRWLIGVAAMLLLGGCDTFGIGGVPPQAPAGRQLDLGSDPLAALVVALDLPPGVQPIENATRAELDVTSSNGSRQTKALLVLADGDGIGAKLPPLVAGHTYYLFGFSAKDKAALGAAQHWLAALPPDAAPTGAFTVTPKLCGLGPLDPKASFSVAVALPDGPPLAPLIDPEPVAAFAGGSSLPACRSG